MLRFPEPVGNSTAPPKAGGNRTGKREMARMGSAQPGDTEACLNFLGISVVPNMGFARRQAAA